MARPASCSRRRCRRSRCVNQLPGVGRTRPATRAGADVSPRRTSPSTPRHVAAYAEVCGFPRKDTVPLPYPHLLAFPLHMAIMTDPSFPFPAIGIGAPGELDHRAPADRASARRFDVTCPRDEPARRTPRARSSTSSTEVHEPATSWCGRTSTYLRRGRGDEARGGRPGVRRGPAGRRRLEAARRPRPPVRRGVGRPQPDPPLPAHRQGVRLPAPDRARHVEHGPLRRRDREPAARRRPRRRRVQEADPAAGHGRVRRRPGPTRATRSR